jgi:hypothetical protein
MIENCFTMTSSWKSPPNPYFKERFLSLFADYECKKTSSLSPLQFITRMDFPTSDMRIAHLLQTFMPDGKDYSDMKSNFLQDWMKMDKKW